MKHTDTVVILFQFLSMTRHPTPIDFIEIAMEPPLTDHCLACCWMSCSLLWGGEMIYKYSASKIKQFLFCEIVLVSFKPMSIKDLGYMGGCEMIRHRLSGLTQDCCTSIANPLELLQSCVKSLKWCRSTLYNLESCIHPYEGPTSSLRHLGVTELKRK